MRNKKHTTQQRLYRLEKVSTQLFLTIVELQNEIKKLNPEYKSLDDSALVASKDEEE